MEDQTIACPFHPSETIQRVSMEKNADQHLYCLDCILKSKSKLKEPRKTLKPLAEFIETAGNFYAKKQEDVVSQDHIPSEMTDILSGQDSKLEVFTIHIEEEKRRASEIFDSLTQEFLQIIKQKKTQVLSQLDQEISNLRIWYTSFEKRLKKAYLTPQDTTALFPTKEDLIAKLANITDSTQLIDLIQSIKYDINEVAIDQKEKAAIQNMSNQLMQAAKIRPYFNREDLDLQKLKRELRERVSGMIEQIWDLQDTIPEVPEGSTFLEVKDFDLIESWLPRNPIFRPKLLFRGSRDGMNGASFHKFCDGKEHTITVINAKFQDSNAVHMLGGYLDKPWHSKGFIRSNDSFVFSLTNKIKCPIENNLAQFAACGYEDQGPCFGGGYDLALWTLGAKSFVCPHSYQKSHQLIEGLVSSAGQAFMEVLEVEVYTCSVN